MITIPRALYSKEITSCIRSLAGECENFDSLDEIDKDKLVALGIKACSDFEVTLSEENNLRLAALLLSKDKDDQHEFMKSIKQNMYDHFSYYFNEMLQEELAWRKSA